MDFQIAHTGYTLLAIVSTSFAHLTSRVLHQALERDIRGKEDQAALDIFIALSCKHTPFESRAPPREEVSHSGTSIPCGQKGRPKPPKATAKPYTRHILGIDSGVQRQPIGNPEPPQSHLKPTTEPSQSHLKATPRRYPKGVVSMVSNPMNHAPQPQPVQRFPLYNQRELLPILLLTGGVT